MIIIKAQWQTHKLGEIYSPPSFFFSWPALCAIFLILSTVFDNVAVAIADGRRQRIENDRLKTSNIVYREVLEMFRRKSKSLFTKCFTVSTYEFIARLQLILVIDQLDTLFLNVFISCLYMFRATTAHHQEGRIVIIHHLV
jgi:hypothetical protein